MVKDTCHKVAMPALEFGLGLHDLAKHVINCQCLQQKKLFENLKNDPKCSF